MSSFRKASRETAPFRDVPDAVQFGLLHDIAQKELHVNRLTDREQELVLQLQEVRRKRNEVIDQMYALERAADAYDRARYEMKHDPHWPEERYKRR